MDELLLSFNIQYLAVGMMGGIMHAFFVRKSTAWQIIGYILAGGLAANFFVPYVLRMLTPLPTGLLSFLIGMGGFRICRHADKWAGSWRPFERTKNE